MWDYDQQMQEDEPGQVLLLKGGMYWDSPVRRRMLSILYGRRLKNLSTSKPCAHCRDSAAAIAQI